MTKVYLGKFVSTHGIKGELKLVSDFEYRERAFKKGFNLYIDDKKYVINSSRSHKQYELISLNDFDNINQVLFLVEKKVFIDKEDLNLNKNEFLLNDLLNAKVVDEDMELGTVTSILRSKVCDYVKVNDEFLIPLIPEYIKEFKDDILYTIKAKNLK